MMRKLFGSTRDELTGEWRKLHTDELHDLCSSPTTDWDIISRMRCKGHVTLGGGGEKKCINVFGREALGKETTGKV